MRIQVDKAIAQALRVHDAALASLLADAWRAEGFTHPALMARVEQVTGDSNAPIAFDALLYVEAEPVGSWPGIVGDGAGPGS